MVEKIAISNVKQIRQSIQDVNIIDSTIDSARVYPEASKVYVVSTCGTYIKAAKNSIYVDNVVSKPTCSSTLWLQ